MTGRFVLRVCLLLACTGGLLHAQLINGRLTTSLYGWERQAKDSTSVSHLRGYENIQLDFGTARFGFHTYLQGSTDFSSPLESTTDVSAYDDPRLRLFNAYLEGKNLGGMFDVRLGRQAVFAGVNYGSFDGALVKAKPADAVQILAYGGGLTPPTQKFEFLKNLKDNWQAGAQLLLYILEDTKISFSYMNRHREFLPFQSLRPDAQMQLVPATIDYGSRANQYGSLDVLYAKPEWWAFGRYDYDFNFERVSRAEIGGRWQATDRLGVTVNTAYRQPTIAYNSYFALFEAEANQEISAGADYRIGRDLTLIGTFSGVSYEDEFDWRISVGAATRYASVMYNHDLSYDGSLDGFLLQATYPMLHGKLAPHVGVTYSNYTLADAIDKTSTLAAVAGATLRPWQSLSVDLQGQFMNNKIYKSDTRLFARISYWFDESFGMPE